MKALQAMAAIVMCGCSAAIASSDAGLDAEVLDSSPANDAASVLNPTTPPKDASSEPKPLAIECGNFQGVIDGGMPVACTGSNWQWASTTLQPQGPCSAMTCPTNAGWNCLYQGQHGYVICP